MKDYYYVLGVDANCSTDDIKEAYRKLSKKFHPDLNQNDSYFENRFKDIQEAYETLSDPKSRRRYEDQFFASGRYTPDQEAKRQRRYPRTTAVDIIFTLVLIGITIVFGRYVINAMTEKPKSVKSAITASVTATPAFIATTAKPVHHKKKRRVLFASAHADVKHPVVVKAPTPAIHPVSANLTANITPAVKAPGKIKIDTVKLKPVAVVNHPVQPFKTVSNVADNNIPYSTYLRGNITGVINMHSTDDLNSDIVAVIPSRTKVLVLQKGDTYYKVQFNGNEGYVPRWTVLTK